MARGTYSTSNYFSVGSAPLTAEPATLSCFFNTSSTALQTLVTLNDTGASSYLMLYMQVAGTFNLFAGTYDGTTVASDSVGTISTNTWHHACGVFASGSSRVAYLDASAGSGNTTSVSVSGIDDFLLGRRSTAGNARVLSGYLAECGLWNVALTTDEISALSAGYSPLLIRPASLIFYAPLVRDTLELTGTGVTETGTVGLLDHPKILYPSRPFIISAPSTGTSITGTLNVTLGTLTSSSSGDVLVDGTLTKTLDDVTSTSAGDVLVDANANVTLDDLTSTSAGDVLVDGSLSKTLDDVTITAAGVVADGRIGTLEVTLDDATSSATADVFIEGATNSTLDDVAISAAADVQNNGSLTATLDDATVSSTATGNNSGNLSVTLDDTTINADATVLVDGISTVTLDDVSISSIGDVPVDAQLSIELDGIIHTIDGVVYVDANLTKTLDDININATGVVGVIEGTLNVTLDDLTIIAGDIIPSAGLASKSSVSVSVGML